MPLSESELASVKAKLVSCFDVLSALGDETRFSIVLTLMDGPCGGRRVADVCRAVHLSRSSVSAQMQVLVQAGFVSARKEGTLVYYYLNPSSAQVQKCADLFRTLSAAIPAIPDRAGDELYGNKVEC